MVKCFTNLSKLGDVVSILVQLKRGLGAKQGKAPSHWAIFCNFLEKIAILMPFGPHFTRFQRHLKKQKF